MKNISLTPTDLTFLNNIQNRLARQQSLTQKQQDYLSQFLRQICTPEVFLWDEISLEDLLELNVWDIEKLKKTLVIWQNLFLNIPGFDCAPNCYILDNDSRDLLSKNTIMIAMFAPSLAYNKIISNEAYEIRLKDDGTASFWFPTFEDAEQHPELYNFRGSWKEAYLLLIEILKKGWPMEEFPDELKPFLK